MRHANFYLNLQCMLLIDVESIVIYDFIKDSIYLHIHNKDRDEHRLLPWTSWWSLESGNNHQQKEGTHTTARRPRPQIAIVGTVSEAIHK